MFPLVTHQPKLPRNFPDSNYHRCQPIRYTSLFSNQHEIVGLGSDPYFMKAAKKNIVSHNTQLSLVKRAPWMQRMSNILIPILEPRLNMVNYELKASSMIITVVIVPIDWLKKGVGISTHAWRLRVRCTVCSWGMFSLSSWPMWNWPHIIQWHV